MREQQRAVTRAGLADPRLRLAVNLFGGPAVEREEFVALNPPPHWARASRSWRRSGGYNSDRLINLGWSRWAFKPEIGVYQPLGPWSLELYGGAWFYTDNDDFLGRFRREQEPIATLQAHVSYTFRPGLWLAADATYYAGGRTTINGVQRDNRQENTRVGLTFSLPIAQGPFAEVELVRGCDGADRNQLHHLWSYLAIQLV